MPVTSMRQNLRTSEPLAPPCSEQWSDNGDDTTPDQETDPATVKAATARAYEALRTAVRAWGGSGSLAALWGVSEQSVNARLGRKEVNGSLSYAFIDYIVIAGQHTAGAAVLLREIGEILLPATLRSEQGREVAQAFALRIIDLLGYQPPALKKKQRRSTDEKFAALVKELRKAGPLGEAALRAAARELGADPTEYDL